MPLHSRCIGGGEVDHTPLRRTPVTENLLWSSPLVRLPPVRFASFGPHLTPGTWLHDWVKFCASKTDAPIISHVATGISVLSACSPQNLMFRPHIGAPVHSAIWCLVVGPSGIGRKSTCVRLATDLLLEVDPNLVGNQPDSAEGLMEEVAASPQTTLVYSELGEFLAKTQPGSRQEGQRTLQTALYDGVTMTRRLARRTVTIEHPRLTILGGVSDTYLERYTRDEDYTGGYMSRFALFGGVSEHDPEGTGDPETAARLRHSLLVRLRRAYNKQVIGPSNLTNDAWAVYLPWLRHRTAMAKDAATNPWLRGTVARNHEQALKAAMLHAFIEGKANDAGWSLDADDLKVGMHVIAEPSLATTTWTVETLTADPHRRRRRELLELLRRGPQSRPALARHFKLPKRHFTELIGSVEAEGLLAEFLNAKGTAIFTLRNLDAVIEDEGDPVEAPHYEGVVNLEAARAARDALLGDLNVPNEHEQQS